MRWVRVCSPFVGLGLTFVAIVVAQAIGCAPASGGDDPQPSAALPGSTADGGHLGDAAATRTGNGADGGKAPLPPTTMCGDTSTDKANCGSCGHDCRGGTCLAGRCQPTLFASTSAAIFNVDGSQLYWLTGAPLSIAHCPLGDCFGGPQQVAGPTGEHVLFAVSNGTVYWAKSTGLPSSGNNLFVSRPRDSRLIPVVDSHGHELQRPVVRDNALYWVDPDYDTSSVSYMTCTLPDCADVRTIYKASDSDPADIAVANGTLYFGFVKSRGPQFTWALAACPTTGCDTPVVLTATIDQPIYLTTDGLHVAWSTRTVPISVCDAPACSGGPVSVLTRDFVNAIALDGSSKVYFVDNTRKTVSRCPVTGCAGSPEILADAQRNPGILVATDTDIYWSVQGAVMRLAK